MRSENLLYCIGKGDLGIKRGGCVFQYGLKTLGIGLLTAEDNCKMGERASYFLCEGA
jgi:hypothetical protein